MSTDLPELAVNLNDKISLENSKSPINRSKCTITRLNCLYTNSCSLLNKLSGLRSLHATYSFDVIAITETWLHSEIRDGEIHIPKMATQRIDRANSRGGGVVL